MVVILLYLSAFSVMWQGDNHLATENPQICTRNGIVVSNAAKTAEHVVCGANTDF